MWRSRGCHMTGFKGDSERRSAPRNVDPREVPKRVADLSRNSRKR